MSSWRPGFDIGSNSGKIYTVTLPALPRKFPYILIDSNHMRQIRVLVILFILCLTALTVRAQAPYEPHGPLHITGQTPLQTRKLDMIPTRPDILSEGEWVATLFSGVANRWNNTNFYVIDDEIFQNQLEIALGVGRRSEIGLNIPVLTRSGGYLDRFIVGFHRLMGLGQADRTSYPFNQLQVNYIDSAGRRVTLLDNNGRKTGLGDVSVIARTTLYSGGGRLSPIIFSALLRFPTASDRGFYGSSGIDGAIGVSSAYRLHPFYLYGTVGYGLYGSGRQYGIGLRPYQWTVFTAVEWASGKSTSFVVQQLINSGIAENFYDFSRPTYEVTLGFKKDLSRHFMIEFGLLENLFIFDNSVDFGVSSAVTYHP